MPRDNSQIDRALTHATDTRRVLFDAAVLDRTAEIFRELFPNQKAVVVADTKTFKVAGTRVHQSLASSAAAPFVFTDPKIYAEHSYVEQLEAHLRIVDAIPIAVGSGTINDLTKLAAHRVGRPYLCVATAASMDGYTAFGSSITYKGSKQTFSCPAPRGVVADLDVIAQAPPELGASGYADLLAKVTAGADWIIADALGIDPIDALSWDLVQKPLRHSLSNPHGIARGDRESIANLTEGLLLGGFAMQAHKTSRPASGAEHQFSHLWDMEHATHASHGFKVGVATLAVTKLYEALLEEPLDKLHVDRAMESQGNENLAELFDNAEVRAKANEETAAKHLPTSGVRDQLVRLKATWPTLRSRLRQQLIPAAELEQMLVAAGAPTRSTEIGIPTTRFKQSFRKAYHIRRRFTVLDIAVHCGILDRLVDQVWPVR
jgi:glycerol-1-phosphate dehydrogenase [NAD(P)+]